ncbi:hypothetical protein Tasa_011_035 [Tanticharoenia sakaeratensis NBRC 103193]|uniref:Uncharacterized protein n=2 Tax=Tanticharoenia TaxID=444052 RepID=A0A0D6MK18_9PROT|nr:hypothetical protein Tasa_011_035 [Tanticharoenia sakaeratensis NBRC 103193]
MARRLQREDQTDPIRTDLRKCHRAGDAIMSIRSIIRATAAASALTLAGLGPLAVAIAEASAPTAPRTIAYTGAPTLVFVQARPGHTLCGDRLGHIPDARILHACHIRSMNEMRTQIAALDPALASALDASAR